MLPEGGYWHHAYRSFGIEGDDYLMHHEGLIFMGTDEATCTDGSDLAELPSNSDDLSVLERSSSVEHT